MKKLTAILLAAIFTLSLGMTAFAAGGSWAYGSGGWWYMYDDGSYPAGTWQQIDGSWYHFDNNGYIETGWIYDGYTWYYCQADGRMATGWVYDGQGWYYISDSGKLATGWQQIDGYWYYFYTNGQMITGWAYVDNTWYYFRPDGVAMAPIYYGDSGNDVWYMQKQLVRLGYLDTADGNYGNNTYAAVCAFKSANGDYAPNGKIDGSTMDLMCSSTTSFSPVNEYSSSSQIYAVQYALVNYGILMNATGTYDSLTRQAVMDIQKEYGLYQSGVCDVQTLTKIFNLPYHGYSGYAVQGYYSNTNWLIYVNTSTNMLYVYYGSYGNWRQQYSWSVSTGAYATPTVHGQFTVDYKGYSFGEDGYTCYYYTSFYGPYLFHSILYYANTFTPMDATLGRNVSHGCVRMAIENAKWIYDNIPIGTKVVVVQ